MGDPTDYEATPKPPSNDDAPFGTYLHEMDVEAFFNIRDWLAKACREAGATCTGAGVGMGQADIDIELEGYRYNISIKPIKR